jgi:hypothetical protein
MSNPTGAWDWNLNILEGPGIDVQVEDIDIYLDEGRDLWLN